MEIQYACVLCSLCVSLCNNVCTCMVTLQLRCCGPESWKDYASLLNKDVIPKSCCSVANRTRYDTCRAEPSAVRINTTEAQARDYLFQTVSLKINVRVDSVESVIYCCRIDGHYRL